MSGGYHFVGEPIHIYATTRHVDKQKKNPLNFSTHYIGAIVKFVTNLQKRIKNYLVSLLIL